MEQKFKVNQMLTNRETGHIERIYAVSKDGQPFDLLEISILMHYEILSLEELQQLFAAHEIEHELIPTGRTFRLTLATKDSAEAYIEHVAPHFNRVLL